MALAELSIKVKVEICPPGFRYRTNWRGKLILQCSHQCVTHMDHGIGSCYTEWRDAKVSDLAKFLTTERIQ